MYYNCLYNCAGVAVGTGFCSAESPPLTDPTLWMFVLAEQSDSQKNGTGIIITTVCTLLAFVTGVICGLITYHCASVLLKKKAANHEQQSTASLNVKKSVDEKRVHYCDKKSATNIKADPEANVVYDEVSQPQPGTPNVQMKLNQNVAYGQAGLIVP